MVRVVDDHGLNATAEFNITVVNVNDPPVIVPIPDMELFEDEPFSLQVEVFDEDLITAGVNETLVFSIDHTSLFKINTSTGLIAFTPGNDDVGIWNVTIAVVDKADAFDMIYVLFEVMNTNDPPTILTEDVLTVLEDETYSVEYMAEDIDMGDHLNWSFETNATWLRVTDSPPGLTGTPLNDNVGWYWVNVTVTDIAGTSDFHNFTLTVVNVNDPPAIVTEDVGTAMEDETYSVDYEATDSDVGDILAWSLHTDAGWLTLDNATGVLEGTPSNDDVGTFLVQVTVMDGEGSSHTRSFDLVVENVNDLPVVGPPPPPTEAIVGVEYRFQFNITDEDAGDVLTFFLASAPVGLTVGEHTGDVSWVPSLDQVGSNFVDVLVTDGHIQGFSNSWDVMVTLPPDNVSPTITSEPPDTKLSLFESFAYNVTASDPETGDALAFELLTGPEGMTIDAVLGHIAWTPGFGDEGSYTVTVQVSDGWGGYDEQTFELTAGGEVDVDGDSDEMSLLSWAAIVVVLVVVGVTVVLWRMR
jgi:hypothetical protein